MCNVHGNVKGQQGGAAAAQQKDGADDKAAALGTRSSTSDGRDAKRVLCLCCGFDSDSAEPVGNGT